MESQRPAPLLNPGISGFSPLSSADDDNLPVSAELWSMGKRIFPPWGWSVGSSRESRGGPVAGLASLGCGNGTHVLGMHWGQGSALGDTRGLRCLPG